MPSQLSVTFSAGADRRLALRKLQTIVDGCVGTRLDIRALDAGNTADLDFPDDVPTEQVLACYQRAVNMAGTPESGYDGGTPALSGDVSSGSLQRDYSV